MTEKHGTFSLCAPPVDQTKFPGLEYTPGEMVQLQLSQNVQYPAPHLGDDVTSFRGLMVSAAASSNLDTPVGL